MIAFAACVADPEKLKRCAVPGLRRAMEPDSVFAELTTTTSIHEVYNEALDHFAQQPDLEALVLLHEDTEILDDNFCAWVREALRDPAAGIVGPIGARNVQSLEWWQGEVAGSVMESRGQIVGDLVDPDVDALDGLMLVLSPWAVHTLRCDTQTFSGFHAYDLDLCFQARAAGSRVRIASLPVFHHTKGGFGDALAFQEADAAFRAKWHLGGGAAVRAA